MEIKFRAWVPDITTMLHDVTVYPDMIGLDVGDFEKSLSDNLDFDGQDIYTKGDEYKFLMQGLAGEDWIFIEKEKINLMQFTGLKDKNGKEIYLGDIVQSNYFNSEETFIGIVEFEKGCFIVREPDFDYESSFDEPMPLYKWLFEPDPCEVIGNIFENPLG